MPFLWNIGQKPLTSKSKRPSPKRKDNSFFDGSIERASLLAFLKRRLQAGMTVEAAIVLPLFLFFFLNLGGVIEMIRLHGNLQLALWEVGNRMCVYGYLDTSVDVIKQSDEDASWSLWEEMGDIVLSYTYIKGQVVNYVGKDYLTEAPLTYGADGLQFWESDVVGQDSSMVSGDVLDIVMTYQVSPLMDIPYVKPFRMSNRYYGRMWTGYDLGGSKEETIHEDEVYVAENAEVYHETSDCTHLKLNIRKVTMSQALQARNEQGGRYTLCSKCGKESFMGPVYIANEGNFYHKERTCSGLKRTVNTMPRQQAQEKYRSCSRCVS